MLDIIPIELFYKILDNLELNDIFELSHVCQNLYYKILSNHKLDINKIYAQYLINASEKEIINLYNNNNNSIKSLLSCIESNRKIYKILLNNNILKINTYKIYLQYNYNANKYVNDNDQHLSINGINKYYIKKISETKTLIKKIYSIEYIFTTTLPYQLFIESIKKYNIYDDFGNIIYQTKIIF